MAVAAGRAVRAPDVALAIHEPHESSPLVVHTPTYGKAFPDDDLELKTSQHGLVFVEDGGVPTTRLFRDELAGLVVLSIPIVRTPEEAIAYMKHSRHLFLLAMQCQTGATLIEMVPPLLIVMLLGQVSGRDSPHVIAAATLADFVSTQSSLNLVMGMSAVLSTMCAQAFGAQQFRQLWLYAQAGLVACLYCLAPITVISWNGEALLKLLGQDPSLAHTASTFIWIGFLSVPFTMVYSVASSALQAQNIATPFIFASTLANAISLPLAYVMGYYTSWGYVGVLLCVTLSSVIKVVAVVPVLMRNAVFIEAWPGWQWREAHLLARQLAPMMAGSVAMATCLALGMSLTGLLCGLLPHPANAMSASSIASLLLTFAYIPMAGLSVAGTVRVGNALGAGQPRRASVASGALCVATFAVSALGVVLCAALAEPYARANTSDDETVRLAVGLSTHLLPFIPLSSGVLALQSIFQACGELWLGAKLNLICLVLVAVPLGVVLALRFHGGVFGLWNGQLLGSLGFLVLASLWLRRLDWDAVAKQARANATVHAVDEPFAIDSRGE
jgi:multidrug resistance protein, MATE family